MVTINGQKCRQRTTASGLALVIAPCSAGSDNGVNVNAPIKAQVTSSCSWSSWTATLKYRAVQPFPNQKVSGGPGIIVISILWGIPCMMSAQKWKRVKNSP